MPRREFIKRVLGTLFSVTSLWTSTRVQAKQEALSMANSSAVHLLNNPQLKTIKPGFLGNPIQDNQFLNPYDAQGDAGKHGFSDILKWRLASKPFKAQKALEAEHPELYGLKVIENPNLLQETRDYICWLGHSSYIIQLNGKRLLTDPCLTAPPMFTRHTALPLPIEQIQPDYLLISHGHYDHLDSDTLQYCSHAKALVPLKMTPIITDMNPTISCQEAGWFQQYDLDESFEISFMPAQHWYRRTPFDKNEILWGSFVIKTPEKTFYFAGDTGYADHFKDIQQIAGKIDLAFLPIGAYEPRWFMKSSHINPQEALLAQHDLGADTLVPMHYGTFDLTDEPLSLPPKVLKENTTTEKVRYLTIGETWLI